MGKFGGNNRGGVVCWRKATISPKRVKIEEKLLWRAYRKSPTLFRTVPSATLYGLPFPKIGGSQPHPKTAITIISGTAKAMDCKFGWYIQRVHPNKRHEKFWRKRSVGVSRDCPNFFEYPLLSHERVKLRKSNLADIFTGSMRTKAN